MSENNERHAQASRRPEQPPAAIYPPPYFYGPPPEEEIDLLEYWRILWRRRFWVVGIALGCGLLAAGISLLMPNIYRAEVLLAPVASEGKGVASALGGLGGLASLAGISLPSSGNVEEALAVLTSREFLWDFIKQEKLMPILFADQWDEAHKRWKEDDPEKQPDLWDAYRLLKKKVIQVDRDKKTGLVTVAVEWKDPKIAAEWANRLVARLNEYLRRRAIRESEANLAYLKRELARTETEELRKALFELITQEQKKAMLANTRVQFAFRVLDSASPPDKKAKPKRALITVLATFVGGFLAVIGVFVREGIERRREEEALQEEASSAPEAAG